MASRLWRFLTTDIAELCSGEVVDNTLEATEAVFGLAEVLKEEGVNVQQLGPLIDQLDSLLDVLNSPLGKIVEKSLPFVSIATGLLRFYLEKSKRKLTLANCVALVSQAAYLESLKQCLKNSPNLLQRIGSVPVSAEIQQQTKNLAKTLELNDEKARQVVTRFPMSEVAKEFGTVLQKRLRQAGLEEIEAQVLTQKIAWGTLRHMTAVWAGAAEGLGHLGQPSFSEWQREQEKYQSIDDYLQDEISTGPEEKIFNEVALTFRKIYVPLQVKRLNQRGQVLENELYDLESWVIQELMVARKLGERTKILFIQGEAGRGKSVFCRMFAERVYRELFPAYIPILIRLRQVQSLENNLTQTLTNCLEHQDFVASDAGWLTDNNTRFLFLLDGFDELLLEGRESGGLKEFLQQVEQFQLRPGNHHRFVITGRPLSLQGIDRLISQTQELERLELQPMNDELQKRWYEQWALQFSQEEAEALQVFLAVCPEDVQNGLAREPLLLYLLGRMHREGRLKAKMFADTIGSTEAKVVIYDEAVRWVLEEQRQRENLRLAGLEPENLRRFLTEAAVCVMQSGNEVAKISFLEARLAQDCNNPVYELLQESRKNVAVSDEKLLNNLLTTFYLQPASGDREGAVEFAHKSFGEFLFAERLKDALEDWSKVGIRRSNSYLVPTTTMHWEIYDLLGYGGLNREIVEYLRVLIFQYSAVTLRYFLID
ncbi:MAG: NACHT domain-containing protein [Leptolyngbya sp. SIO3F4]|nr:NACHT domain-containing protein [Leptolyngbya sp. SIO3F4]